MGAHIPVDGGDFFLGGILLEGKGEGVGAFRHWIFVSFFASCLCGCWGPFFLFGGGGRFCWKGKGEWVVLLDNGCVVPFLWLLFKCTVGTFSCRGGGGGGGVGALTSRFSVCVGVCLFSSRQLFAKIKLLDSFRGSSVKNWNDTEKISMAPAQG